tara:strand:- start:813 stop:2534 length:1722 start_codon:yes stop_codon:yes gene_type:complete
MNLAEIREAMFAQADWSPDQSPEATKRVTGFINRAYNQIAREAPYLFFEDTLRATTEPDVKSASDSDLIEVLGTNAFDSAENDPWSFKTTYTKTAADADSDGLYTTTWKTDRSWDGRTIEIETGTHKVRNQIRTIWHDSADDRWKLTLVHPFDIETHGSTPSGAQGFKWRIYTEDYALPDDVITMRSMRLFNNTQQYPLEVMGQDEAEGRMLVGPRGEVAAGIPRVAFRREHFQLEGPGRAPRVGVDEKIAWNGPETPGEFEYIVTYTWGKRDADFRLPGLAKWDSYAKNWFNTGQTISSAVNNEVANNRIREPRYESAPSPASAKIAVGPNFPNAPTGYFGIVVTVPNIEYVLGFLTERTGAPSPSGKRVSQHQSGIHVRIYRRRVADVDLSSFSSASYDTLTYAAEGMNDARSFVDNKEKFYLLAEMRVDEDNKGVFIDDGQYIPDRSRPLRDTHGYQQYAVYPRPDQRYEMDIRCVRRPQKLEDERDVPRLHAESVGTLVDRAMAYLYESMGNFGAAETMMKRYESALELLNKRYGDLRPAAVPVLRRMVRARYSYRSRDSYRKWYKTSN